MEMITFDYIDKISLDSNQCFNESRTLHILFVGLLQIADSLKQREAAWDQQNAGGAKFQIYGLDMDGTKSRLDLIACYFHWFGVSICNYTRLIGFIRGLSVGDFSRSDLKDATRFKSISKSIDHYVQNVPELASVLAWRNKVGAHFAITDPRKEDNVATLDMSVMFPVTFTNGLYRVGELTLTKKTSTGTHTSNLPCWSLTEVFESLILRYWPHITIKGPCKQSCVS